MTRKNIHMRHIEDCIIYDGYWGIRRAIDALKNSSDHLENNHQGSISVKWDGAPAIFAGTDPTDGKFFVAKKGIFNKNPKVYKTNADIDADTNGDLADKLKLALKYLPSLNIQGVIQGDFLFGPGDVKAETIKGDSYATFHPNTIVYAIPIDTHEARRAFSSQIGIVWHTTYIGDTFQDMEASYGVDVSALNTSDKVWSQDAMLRTLSSVTPGKKQTREMDNHFTTMEKQLDLIPKGTLDQLQASGELSKLVEMFGNTFVRKGENVLDTKKHVEDLIEWIQQRYMKEANKRKTEAGKLAQLKKLDLLLEFFSVDNKAGLKKVFDLQKLIILAKLKLINTLNRLQNIDTFIKTKDEFRVTGAEGYVIIDNFGSDALKVIDRMEFSYNNFSSDILKGWDQPEGN